MPEGPEVKAYAEALNDLLCGSEVTDVNIISGRYINKNPKSFLQFSSSLPLKINKISCKGKFLYFSMSDDSYVWNTLGMSGTWSASKPKYARLVLIALSPNGLPVRVFYGDMRNFGTFKFCMSSGDTKRKLSTLGADFLSESVSFNSSIFDTNKTLAEFLMNQANYAGVGNYIKAEALYRALLSPHRICKSLSMDERLALHNSIRDVMTESFKSKKIRFNQSKVCGQEFNKVVYKKALDPDGNRIKAEQTKDGRTTYWVPNIQK